MYFPVGWPQTLKSTEGTISVVANTDRSLFALLSQSSLSIWFCRPSLKIVSHRRDTISLSELGNNVSMVWRPDSTLIVIQTNNDYLLFYKLIVGNETNLKSESLFQQKDVDISGLRRESAELFIGEKIPSLVLVLSFSTKITSGIMCLMAAEEEMVIGTKSGEICGVNWDGSLDPSFLWKLTSHAFNIKDDISVIDIKYSSMIGGFGLVFSCGRAAFMPLHSHLSQPSTPEASNSPPHFNSRLQFVAEVDNAICCAINHKYQLIAFGLSNTEGVLCCLDDTENAIVVTHRLILSADTFPDASFTAGGLTCLQWSQDSTVVATAWQKGGFAIWSVFGALIACSLSWDFGVIDAIKSNPFIVNSMAFGKEGYHLWICTKNSESNKRSENGNPCLLEGVSKLMMAKSVVASNPSSCFNGELVLLNAEDRLFIGIGAVNVGQQHYSSFCTSNYVNNHCNGTIEDDIMPSTNVSSGEMHWEQQPIAVGNLQWIVINMPNNYLATNWPIRYSAIDNMSQHIAIAGRSGLALYSLAQRKWKLFGNESQEKDFEVCGGLLWYNEYIVLSCYNIIDNRYELRAYSHKHKLDNQFVRVAKVENEVLLMSAFTNRLLTYLIDGSIHLFGLNVKTHNHMSSLHIIHLNQIVISNLIVPPECVTLIILTNLHIISSKSDESILMNICGRLLLLERESAQEDISSKSVSHSPIVYKKASILASGVENVWVSNMVSKSDRPHLTESLYLSCGSNGMGIWLPLLPCENQSSSHSFMSKRIMLPISTHIYPLAVLFRDAVVLGAENDTIMSARHLPISFPFSIVSRTSQVYLHDILRELLRRNLGLHAWEIANSCTNLPYFPHSLELLLHEVLEEEATSSHPIPDALLPQVIDFIREFPVFLQTVVHCARKTELALWPHLFSIVGNPKELFQRCLAEGQLETAASYIIVLQNLENTSISKQYATLLLDAARSAGCWQVVKDLMRFLRAIDPSDIEIQTTRTSISSSNGQFLHSRSSSTSSDTVIESIQVQAQTLQPKTLESTEQCAKVFVNNNHENNFELKKSEMNGEVSHHINSQQSLIKSKSLLLSPMNGFKMNAFPGTIMRTTNSQNEISVNKDEKQGLDSIQGIVSDQISSKEFDQNCTVS